MFIFGLRTCVQSVAKIKAFKHSFGFRVRPQAGVRVRVRPANRLGWRLRLSPRFVGQSLP